VLKVLLQDFVFLTQFELDIIVVGQTGRISLGYIYSFTHITHVINHAKWDYFYNLTFKST